MRASRFCAPLIATRISICYGGCSFPYAVSLMSISTDKVIPIHTAKTARLKESDYARQFETLLRPYMENAFRLAFRFCGNVDDAEDLVQDLLIKLYAKRIDLTEIEQVQPWLAKTMYRLYIDNYRKFKRSPMSYLDDEDVNLHTADEAVTPQTQTQRSQLQAMIVAGLKKLSDEHRVLIILCDMEGYSIPEVQQILEIPDGTIKSRLHRARSKLREFIKPNELSGC